MTKKIEASATEEEFVNETPADFLSTKGRLLTYNEQLKASLENGVTFTQVMDVLINTTDKQELLEAVLKLSDYQLDSAYLLYLQKYSLADFYLIFINRLLQIHQNEHVTLCASEQNDELYHEYPSLRAAGYFVFKPLESSSGAYYIENTTKHKLFFIDIKQRILRFNNQALTDLFIIDYGSRFEYEDLNAVANLLLSLGRYLKEDYGFDVEFGLLDPLNTSFFEISHTQMPKKALDRLFIKASDSGYMLTSGLDNEAILNLGEITLTICPQTTRDGNVTWGILIFDEKQAVSWFKLIFNYDFLKEWYLENLSDLELTLDTQYF